MKAAEETSRYEHAESPRTTVILISGHAQNGKDTAAKMIADRLNEKGNKVLVTHFADLVKYICKEFFNWNGLKDETGRSLLQYVGTDVVRRQCPDYWVDFIGDTLTMFRDEWDWVIVPDARFENEISRLKDYYGLNTVHIRIERPMFDSGLTSSQKQHSSETALDAIKPDYLIINDGGLDELSVKVNSVLFNILTADHPHY